MEETIQETKEAVIEPVEEEISPELERKLPFPNATVVNHLRKHLSPGKQIKKQVNDFSDKVLMFGEELGNTAKKNDVKVIEKYLTMWNPQQFITRKELKQYLEYNKPNFQQKESEEN